MNPRIIFSMEVISHYVLLLLLYPIIRITLIPVYLGHAIVSVSREQEASDESDVFEAAQSKADAEQMRVIEELLPSDAPTRALLKGQHKIWKVLRHHIEINEHACPFEIWL